MATTDEIFDYVMTNPYNTNPNQLRTMLDSVGGGSGSNAVICELTDNGSTITAAMTAGELAAAIDEGKTIIFTQGAYRYYLTTAVIASDNTYFSFMYYYPGVSTTYLNANSSDAYPSRRSDN